MLDFSKIGKIKIAFVEGNWSSSLQGVIRDRNGLESRNFCIVNIFFFFNLNGVSFIYFLLLNFLWIKNKIETMRNNRVPWKLLLLVRILLKIHSIGYSVKFITEISFFKYCSNLRKIFIERDIFKLCIDWKIYTY